MNKAIITIFILLIYSSLNINSCIAQDKRALLIGISDYGNIKENPDLWTNISGANDIKLLAPLLIKQGFIVDTIVDKEATHATIIKSLNRLIKKSEKGGIVYIHFSMHGQPYEDLNGDENDGWDEAIIPFDAQKKYIKGVYEGQNHLLDDDLEKYFDKMRYKLGKEGQLYVVLDACHSGTSSRGNNEHVRGTREAFTHSNKEYIANRSLKTNDYFNVLTKEGQSPVTFLEACRSYQQNKELLESDTYIWYGSLSYYVAQSIKKNAIAKTATWIDDIKYNMDNDNRLRRQNMVIEQSVNN